MLYEIDVSIDDPQLVEFFKKRSLDINTDIEGHGRLLFFRTNKIISLVNAAVTSLPSQGSLLKPNRIFDRKQKFTFHDCVIFVSLYFLEPIVTIENILTTTIETDNEIVTEILAPTNGYLLFNTQFEQLCQAILELPRDKSVQFRRLYNKRSESIEDFAVDLNRLTEFMGILDNHMITDCVLTPDFLSAKNLFHCLRNQRR